MVRVVLTEKMSDKDLKIDEQGGQGLSREKHPGIATVKCKIPEAIVYLFFLSNSRGDSLSGAE